jgi:hypothetical protein
MQQSLNLTWKYNSASLNTWERMNWISWNAVYGESRMYGLLVGPGPNRYVIDGIF